MPTLHDLMHTATDALRAEGIEFTASARWDSSGDMDGTIEVHVSCWHAALDVLPAALTADGVSVLSVDGLIVARGSWGVIHARPAAFVPAKLDRRGAA